MKHRKLLHSFLGRTLILVMTLSASQTLWASSEKQYLAFLHYASDKVQSKKQKNSQSRALSTPLVNQLLGRYYQVGDRWRVLSWIYQYSSMRKIEPPQSEEPSLSPGGLFEYEVKEIKSGFNPEITLAITQISHPELLPIDPQVERLSIVLNDQLVEQKKFYAFKQQNDFISVPLSGVGKSLSPLGLYPLDLPEISSAEEHSKPHLPQLPKKIQSWAERFSWKMNLDHTRSFEHEDFFGRPIEALWEKGKPWPSYLKTPRGISILIESGDHHAL